MHANIPVPKVGGDFLSPFYQSNHTDTVVADHIFLKEIKKSSSESRGGEIATDKKKSSTGKSESGTSGAVFLCELQ